jgi:hypothetical protein
MQAVLEAIAYADVFDWPLTEAEIQRRLPCAASREDVSAALRRADLRDALVPHDGYWMFRGREHLADVRRRKNRESRILWRAARRYARVLERVPWIQCVAVSGSLAMSAADKDADVDFFIVTDDDRLWLSRAAAIACGRALAGPELCPNYIVSVSAMTLSERDMYTAHEITQLVPLSGHDLFRQFLAQNRWYLDFLPNQADPVSAGPYQGRRRRNVAVDALERWEMRRKIDRLRRRGEGAEVQFDHARCKGHFDGHRQRFWRAFDDRLAKIEALAR